MIALDILCAGCAGHGWVWAGDSTDRQTACLECSGTGVGSRAGKPDWFVLVDVGSPVEPDAALVGPFFTREAAAEFITSLGADANAQLLDALDPNRVKVSVTKGEHPGRRHH